MEKVIPMSWLNQMLLLFSILSASLCLIIQEWAGLTPLPIYISISWAVFLIIVSIWFSCYICKLTLKANKPLNIDFINKWICKRLGYDLKLDIAQNDEKTDIINANNLLKIEKDVNTNRISANITVKANGEKCQEKIDIDAIHKAQLTEKRIVDINEAIKEINLKCIELWYQNISDDKSFPEEARELLRKLLIRLFWKITLIDKVKLSNKLADVLLLHLKEYRRALRRVEKGSAVNIEEAYKCLHPGSRSTPALEHMLHRLVTLLAQEFLQWELSSSLPCKLLLSILAKRLFVIIDTVSCPNWIFENLLELLLCAPTESSDRESKQNGIVSAALNDGITSATAAVIPRQLPTSTVKSPSDLNASITPIRINEPASCNTEKTSLYLEGLAAEHKGLWNDTTISDLASEINEDRISPVYEEPTDFATTIARLRSILQQKSTATTPLHPEEKSYAVYDGCQFTNLSIPWTEFHTASDGSQQLLYCIQFDDVEQRGVDLFETTTATVRRQYSDFAQLHSSLEEVPSLSGVMLDLVLPKGGRIEMENYLRTLCTRLSTESPPQLRHFLRPNSGAGKKADAVAPRFDRFLAKTVTGVFNTLKTVVPGFEIEQEEEVVPLPTLMPLADIPWRFVEDVKSMHLLSELQQLVAERTDYCSAVETAYEAVDSIEGSDDSDLLIHWWETVNTTFDEEIDDLDSSLSLSCAAIDVICELLAGIGSNNTLQQEAVVRWTKLLLGNITEPVIQKTIHLISDYLSNISITCSRGSNYSEELISVTKDKIFQILDAKIPYDIRLIFGEDDIRKILKYLLNSCEVKKINLDFSLQVLEVLASQLLISCRLHHDNFSP